MGLVSETTIDGPAIDAEWTVSPVGASLGAEITGVDLATAGPAEVAAITRHLLDHKVLFFPGQHLDIDTHVAFGKHFGPLDGHPNLKNAYLDHPEIFELAATKGGIADEWHTDLTFLPEPSVMSILHMVQCPDLGGDTMWTDLCAAYDALSAPIQELCDGLTAFHNALPHGQPEKSAVHPVVRIHPETGRKVLYVNEHFTRRIVEMSHQESELLLGFLTNHVKDARFTVRYRWSPGTIAIWDNRCTQHCVLNDFDGERLIQRVTVMGDRPEGPRSGHEEPRWPRWFVGRSGALTRHDREVRHYFREQDRSQLNAADSAG